MREYSLGIYEKAMPSTLNWKEKLRIAKKYGYDFVEISIDETAQKLSRLDWSDFECRELVDLIYDVGVPIHTMCLSGHRKYPLGSSNRDVMARSMEIMKKAICIAEKIGIRIIQLAGYDVYYEIGTKETREHFLINLRKAVEMAACAGVVLGFETMETAFMDTVEKTMHYVNAIQSPYLNVYPDVGNLKNASLLYGTDMMEDMQLGTGSIVALHLKETLPGKYREVPFGTGHVDFEKVISTAWKLGVRKFTTEFWYTGNECWENDIQIAADMMRGYLDEVSQKNGGVKC